MKGLKSLIADLSHKSILSNNINDSQNLSEHEVSKRSSREKYRPMRTSQIQDQETSQQSIKQEKVLNLNFTQQKYLKNRTPTSQSGRIATNRRSFTNEVSSIQTPKSRTLITESNQENDFQINIEKFCGTPSPQEFTTNLSLTDRNSVPNSMKKAKIESNNSYIYPKRQNSTHQLENTNQNMNNLRNKLKKVNNKIAEVRKQYNKSYFQTSNQLSKYAHYLTVQGQILLQHINSAQGQIKTMHQKQQKQEKREQLNDLFKSYYTSIQELDQQKSVLMNSLTKL